MNGRIQLTPSLSSGPLPRVEGLWKRVELTRAVEQARLEERQRIAQALYDIARESLSNVRKHAHAPPVAVSLRCDPDGVTVTVQDDGLGLAGSLPPEPDDGALRFGLATL